MANNSKKVVAPKTGRAYKASPAVQYEPSVGPHEAAKPHEGVMQSEAVKPDEVVRPAAVVRVPVIRTIKGDKAMSSETHNGSPVLNGVKAAGEAFAFPGASLILDGNVKSGTTHLAGAALARVLIGPIGWFAFAADSFSKSVTGKSLYSHFSGETIKL